MACLDFPQVRYLLLLVAVKPWEAGATKKLWLFILLVVMSKLNFFVYIVNTYIQVAPPPLQFVAKCHL